MNTTNLKHLTLLLAATLALTACGPDNPEPDPQPEHTPDNSGKWVIVSYYLNSTGNSQTYKYDSKGRIEEITADNGEKLTARYGNLTISVTWTDFDSDDNGMTEWTLENGLVTSFDDYQYSYDNNNRLSRIDGVGDYSLDHSELKWDNADMLTGANVTEEIDYSVVDYSIKIGYDKQPSINPECIENLNAMALGYILNFYIDYPLTMAGYFGKLPSALITEASYDGPAGGFMAVMLEYSNLDSNNCPQTIKIYYRDGSSDTIKVKWQKL